CESRTRCSARRARRRPGAGAAVVRGVWAHPLGRARSSDRPAEALRGCQPYALLPARGGHILVVASAAEGPPLRTAGAGQAIAPNVLPSADNSAWLRPSPPT